MSNNDELTVILVDLNNMARFGMIKASMRRVTAELTVGEVVIARDEGEGDFRAVVREIVGKTLYLELDWESAIV